MSHDVADPLRRVLQDILTLVASHHGAPAAAEFVLMLVASLAPEDRNLAANVILTSDIPSDSDDL